MNLADKAKSWLDDRTPAAYTGLVLAFTCIVAVAVFGIIPNAGLLIVNAFLSGCVWSACVVMLVLGGGRVKSGYYCAFAMIAGGLTMSIPSIFADHSPVDWGTTVSRLGIMVLVSQVTVDLIHKWRNQPTGEIGI